MTAQASDKTVIATLRECLCIAQNRLTDKDWQAAGRLLGGSATLVNSTSIQRAFDWLNDQEASL